MAAIATMEGKIGRLTGAQLKELPSLREAWLGVEALTSPADHEEAEAGIAEAYQQAGLVPPRTICWASDPALGTVLAATLAQRGGFTAHQIWVRGRREAKADALRRYQGRVWGQVKEALEFRGASPAEAETVLALQGLVLAGGRSAPPDAAGRRESADLDGWAQRELWGHDRIDYRRRGFALAQQASGELNADLPFFRQWRRPERPEISAVLDWAFGQRAQLEELALYDALARFGGTPFDSIRGVVRVATSAGWWWPFENAAVVCERPTVRTLDPEGRLHNEDGPALDYADGFCAYFWHGRAVPKWVVTDPTVERIAAEGNVEVRRCAIEALSWARFAEEAELTLVDACVDPGNAGQLLSLHAVPGRVWGAPARVLICTNGSVGLDGGRHTFGLLVPATIQSALGAAAWGYGLTAEEYSQLQRRA